MIVDTDLYPAAEKIFLRIYYEDKPHIMKLLHANSNISVLTVILMLQQVILINDSVHANTISHKEGI